MEFTSRNARMMSRIGARASYGQALSSIAADNKNIIALSADLGRSSGLDRFSKENANQFINTGIAEQNLVGTASGLARTGFSVFASTFAPFASLRASEQVRMNMGYMQEPVNLVALGSGLALAYLGNSHFGLEDIAVMRGIPDINITCPADCFEIYKTLESAVSFQKPLYIRLTGAINCPIVYKEDYKFEIGKAVEVKKIKSVNVISHGTTVGHCKLAIEQLEAEGFEVGLINFHTIKPLDNEALDKIYRESSKILIFEEHVRNGGLGSAILEHYNDFDKNTSILYRYGIDGWVKKTGTYNYMLSETGLDSLGIKSTIEKHLK